MKTWVRKDGTEIKISQMHDMHLINAIKLTKKSGLNRLEKELRKELKKRGLEIWNEKD